MLLGASKLHVRKVVEIPSVGLRDPENRRQRIQSKQKYIQRCKFADPNKLSKAGSFNG